MRRAREELWWILEATAADVLQDDWLRHTSPFWMAIALEDADKPLVQRQRGAVKELLALEKARWGRELRVLRDKLQAALLEYDKEMLAHEMAEIRREERRARAVTSTKPNISTKTRRAKAYKVHCDDDEDLRPFDAPCVEMYLRRRSRSRSKSQERCSQERARLWAERRSAEADQLEREDGGDEMMSRLVEAVEPAMFRTLLLQNLICKLRQVSTQACFCVLQYSGLENVHVNFFPVVITKFRDHMNLFAAQIDRSRLWIPEAQKFDAFTAGAWEFVFCVHPISAGC